MEMLRDSYGENVHIFQEYIPYTVRLEETPAEGISIYRHDSRGKAAMAYQALTKEVLDHENR
jgi:chromosome partitioning protein